MTRDLRDAATASTNKPLSSYVPRHAARSGENLLDSTSTPLGSVQGDSHPRPVPGSGVAHVCGLRYRPTNVRLDVPGKYAFAMSRYLLASDAAAR